MHRRDLRRYERELPHIAGQVARDLRSGLTLVDAMRRSADGSGGLAAADLARVVRATERGVPMADVLHGWRSARRSTSVDLFVAACQFVHRHGGSASVAFDGVAAALTDRLEVTDEIGALTAQARLSATVLMSLPLVGVLGFTVVDRRVGGVLVGTPAGWSCLALGGVLEAAGVLVVRRLVRSVSP
ncbi:MAG: type II secretion system F family protein [Actinomycetes bacterium]